MTLAGAHVRLIGAAVIDCKALSVAASGERIAVGTSRDTNQVFVFALDSGALLYTFGPKGLGEGQLCRSRSMRFTPDGAHIIIAENFNYRLSVFKMCGEFVRWIGVDSLEWPNDVDFAPNGDILVADHDHDRVCMFSSDGSTLIRTFGSEGAGPGEFIYPIGLALHSGLLYVLDEGTARVQVFS